ncbi:Barstar (barnase inhibitor) [Actinomadura meyerae]|uniref:Barstar (Barnase inhibitor) n=1 Tax=Actinomadura meyerae TaxID=240840 RepID=A0A239P4V2_9ACTN|nr:barstar family protein [Actinomadura meyerae]SNT61992.1 Barstar (barnase inhibitor) [Actinomadura meyerae]
MSVKYSVRFEESDTYIPVGDLEGFFVGRYSDDDFGALLDEETARVDFRLVRPILDGPIETLRGDIEVLVLDTEGRPMGRYGLWAAKVLAGDTPEDLVVTARTGVAPHAEARRLWDRFRVSEPRLGEWRTLQVGAREAWLEVAVLRHSESALKWESSTPSREIFMEGDDIKDVASFFCAIGEAFRGPGGYIGCSFSDLDECLVDYLKGAPVRLTWRNISVARSSLSAVLDFADGPISKFDLILDILSQNNVEVISDGA